MRLFLMREYDLRLLITDKQYLQHKLKELEDKKLLFHQKSDVNEIAGHLQKSEHNLRFVAECVKTEFLDWALTGCYYACYHAALSLILMKGYTSKNHLATLCVLVKEFYGDTLNEQDIQVFNDSLDYEDLLFYVESKNKREDSSYATHVLFDVKDVEKSRIKTILFVNRAKEILKITPK